MSANLISAVHDLVLESGLGAKNIAAAVGKPYSTLLREVNPFDDGAKLGAETLVDIIGRGSERIMDLLRMSEDIGRPARALQPRMNSGADSSSALRSCGVRT